MEIVTQLMQAGLLISMKGALDGLSEEVAKVRLMAVLQLNTKYFFLDFADVTEVTPGGLRALLPHVQQVQEQKKMLILFNLKESIQELVIASGFDSLVKVVDSLDTAITYAKGRELP